MFLMIPSTKIAQMVLLCQKGDLQSSRNKYLQMKSPEPLVQNQKKITEMVLKLPSTQVDQKFSLAEQHGHQS